MPCAKVNGIRLHYERTGTGDPIILLTGFGGDSGFWRKASEILSKEYDVITLDNRGSGNTEYNGSFSITDLAEDVVALIEHLDLKNVSVLGWSMGSHIAMRIALSSKIELKTLVLVSSYLFRPARSDYILSSMMDAVEDGAPIEVLARVMNCMCYTEEFFERMARDNKEIRLPKLSDVKGLRHQLNAVNGSDLTKFSKDIRVPTLVIHGDKDIMVDHHEGAELADNIPNCEFLTINGAGHLIPAEQYIPAAMDFIKKNSD